MRPRAPELARGVRSFGCYSQFPSKRGGSRRAFTLIEVLVVLGILVLLTGIAWPLLEKRITGSHLPESAHRIKNMLFMARSEAVMQHRRFRIRFEEGAQQPIIEYEPEPIRSPGEFEPSDVLWAREPMLLADVQVHEVRIGRPAYLRPLRESEDPDTVQEEAELEEEERIEREVEGVGIQSGIEEDADIEEDRPLIVFETDGSTEWATLIVSRVPPGEELEEEDKQFWVVLDGRTGLAFVREKVTEEQMSDPEFYVEREKLELPDDKRDFGIDSGFSLGGAGGLMGGSFASGGLGPETTSGGSTDPQLPDSGLLEGLGAGGRDGRSGTAGGSSSSTGGTEGGKGGDTSGGNGDADVTDTDSELEKALADTDLTEEEKENIREEFKKGGR